jgi:inorganic pyrophosphatase
MTGPTNLITVFIENEAASNVKHHYDEKTLAVIRTERVRAEYPYPYGFIPGTLAPDGDAVDCFVLTDRSLPTGTTVDVLPVAFVEQTEAGSIDNNVLAVMPGETAPETGAAVERIAAFIEAFRAGDPDNVSTVGRTLGRDEAVAYIAAGRAAHGARQQATGD